jgi:hypothetical protein
MMLLAPAVSIYADGVTASALLIVLLADGTAAVCQVNSINDCIQQSGILQLQQNNPTVYCLSVR